MPRLLMCPPEHYALRYEINAWMHLENQPDLALARRQWQTLYEQACQIAQVELISPAPECPDMVFTANAGLVVREREILLSRFRHPERRTEEPHFRRWFEEHGYIVHTMPEDCPFEGEGDILRAGERYLAGYRKRTEICAHRIASEYLDREVLSLELVDDRWYHLDTALFVLDERTVVYYPGAFDTYARRVIEEHFDTLCVVEEEAMRFACNSVVIGQTVLMPEGCPLITALLERRGYKVIPIPMSEFIKSGGACKCLVMFLE
ncbi:MAG: dimethylarginine dimethylaminohydrolase family protein [Armatimonadota bacterium]